MATHLVESTCHRMHPQQGTAGFMGATQVLNRALGLLQDTAIIFHWSGDVDGLIVGKITTNKGDIGLVSVCQRLLERCSPASGFGKEKATRGLKIKSVYWVYVLPDLISDPLQTGLRSRVVRISMNDQSRRFCDDNPVFGLGKHR